MVVAWKKRFSVCILPVLLAFVFAGCGNSPSFSSNQNTPAVDTTPVTLTLSTQFGFDDNDPFGKMILQKIKEKFPYITLNVVHELDKGSSLSDQLAQNTPPDLLYSNQWAITERWDPLGLAADLTPFIQKYKVDLNRLNPSWVEYVRNQSTPGAFQAMPFLTYYDVIYYNKDIFDKFGVPYPTDGMTWPDFLNLAKKVTKNDNGMQYRGFEPRSLFILANEYPLLTIDPKTGQADVTNDKWTQVFQYFKDVYQIPGNMPDWSKDSTAAFTKDRTLAMLEQGGGGVNMPDDMHWDMVALPAWPDAPTQHPAIGGRMFALSAASQHKDQAFQVIQYLISDEIQDQLARSATVPAVVSKTLLQDYGKDVAALNGHNLNAVPYGLSHYKMAVFPANRSKWETIGINDMANITKDIAIGNKDINTALRDAADKINKDIATAQQNN